MAVRTRSGPTSDGPDRSTATASVMFAGLLMIITGILGVLQGAAAIARDNVYVLGVHYAYSFYISTWGWIHVVLGALLAITGFCLLAGAAWARWVGLMFAAVGIALQFMFVPYYPLWSIIVIALDAFVIWALVSEHTDVP